MSPRLSDPDPNWWPAPPPPKPPQPIPRSAIAVGGIVGVAVAAAIAYAVLSPRSSDHSTVPSAPVRSLAAFESCLDNQGVLTPSAETNDAMLRPAALACRAYVPVLAKSRDPVATAQQALQQCLQDAQSKLRSPAGSLGSFAAIAAAAGAASARSAFQKASAVCRAQSFDEPGGDVGSAPGSAPTPIA